MTVLKVLSKNKNFLFIILILILIFAYLKSHPPVNNDLQEYEQLKLESHSIDEREGLQKMDHAYIDDGNIALDLKKQLNYTAYEINGEVIHVYKPTYLQSFTKFNIAQAEIKFLVRFKNPCLLEEMPVGQLSKDSSRSPKSYLRLPGIDEQVRLRCFPHYMLLGVAKSGTTDFSSRVTLHPQVFKGDKKEIYWWNQYRVITHHSLSSYSNNFDSAIPHILAQNTSSPNYTAVCGEMTSITLTDMPYWRQDTRNIGLSEPKYTTAHDIYSLNPHTKLIILLRDPTSRLYSQYNMFRRFKNPTPEEFHMLVLNSIDWWNKCLEILPERACLYGSPPEMPPVEHRIKSWWPVGQNYTGEIRCGLYSLFIKDYLDVIPKENLLIIESGEYNRDKLEVMNSVYEFIGVPTLHGEDAAKVKHMKNMYSHHYAAILPETKLILDEFYRPYNFKLAKLLNDNKWLWNE